MLDLEEVKQDVSLLAGRYTLLDLSQLQKTKLLHWTQWSRQHYGKKCANKNW